MKIIQAFEPDLAVMAEKYPHIKDVICAGENAFTLIAKDDDEQIIAFLSAFFREIPAPVHEKTECFINVIDVLEPSSRRKRIGSALVQDAIKIAKESNAVQIRAYCEIGNVSSHMLWFKNGFGISPVKHHDGSISGSFVTYRIV